MIAPGALQIANRMRIALIVVLALVCSCSWARAGEEVTWPAEVLKSVYIPPSAKDIRYGSSGGLFMVSYRADICYPARGMIEAMAAMMKSAGWVHLKHDPLNPGSDMPPESPGNDWSWLGFFPWNSYWKDSAGNVVSYIYSYKIPGKLSPREYFEALTRSCLLDADVIYFQPDALRKVQKDVEEMRKEIERP